MFFLNLGAGEFFALLGTVGGLITALYLLDRSKRKRVVSSLRFWAPALRSEQQNKRKSVQEPWSLLLQLVSLLLLLLAVAQLEWGVRETRIRNHVLLLDVSSVTGQRSGGGTLLQREKSLAGEYLRGLGTRDRVMLVRVDDLATPVTPFTNDRTRLIRAVNESAQSYSALDFDRVLSYARQAQSWSEGSPGEIVYIGPRRVRELPASKTMPPGLRVVPVEATKEDYGISGIGITRAEAADNWHASVRLKNYGTTPRNVVLQVKFAGTSFAARSVALNAGQEKASEYDFITGKAGQLSVRMDPPDAFDSDNAANVAVPENKATRVAVYSARPNTWRPLLGANSRLDVRYFAPAQYEAKPHADLMILDQFAPALAPAVASLWVDPPKAASPIPVKTAAVDQVIQRWNPDAQLGAGLRAKDVRVSRCNVFVPGNRDFAVASVAAGPVVMVRAAAGNQPKLAVAGFDLLSGQMRFEVSGPLLFANLVRWLTPEAFRTLDLEADPVGVSNITLDANENVDRLSVTDDQGRAVPFTTRRNRLQFYVDAPAIVQVTSDQRERVLSLVLPEVAEYEWKPPADVPVGLPGTVISSAGALGLWRELAALGALLLMIEWLIYGRRRRLNSLFVSRHAPETRAAEPDRELMSK